MKNASSFPVSIASAIALPALVLLGCSEHVERGPRVPVAAIPPCTNTWSETALDEEWVGVSRRPPVRRAPPEFEDADPDAVRLFHDALASYGTWTDDARLGLVWVPSHESVGSSFVPYGTHGRWTHRDLAAVDGPAHEYVWVSDLPWGWVTFHYGRWAYTGDRGWAWVAGRKYAGAWVDWRLPSPSAGPDERIVGWGPTPPGHVWRVVPGRLVATPYTAYATPYSYAHARDLFRPDLGHRLLPAGAALAVAAATEPTGAPSPERLGFRTEQIPAPPVMDRGLQQAWMLATPATAFAVGAGPELGPAPRLRTFVAGGARYAIVR